MACLWSWSWCSRRLGGNYNGSTMIMITNEEEEEASLPVRTLRLSFASWSKFIWSANNLLFKALPSRITSQSFYSSNPGNSGSEFLPVGFIESGVDWGLGLSIGVAKLSTKIRAVFRSVIAGKKKKKKNCWDGVFIIPLYTKLHQNSPLTPQLHPMHNGQSSRVHRHPNLSRLDRRLQFTIVVKAELFRISTGVRSRNSFLCLTNSKWDTADVFLRSEPCC